MLVISIFFAVLLVPSILFYWLRIINKPTHAGGIVYKNENGHTLYLVVTSSAGKHKWVLPKGRIEKKETPETAAVREVLEEAGIAAKPVKKAGTVRFTKKGRRVKVEYYIMEFVAIKGGSKEERLVEWMEKPDAIERLGSSSAKNILLRV